jgi:hypothetical protein
MLPAAFPSVLFIVASRLLDRSSMASAIAATA